MIILKVQSYVYDYHVQQLLVTPLTMFLRKERPGQLDHIFFPGVIGKYPCRETPPNKARFAKEVAIFETKEERLKVKVEF